MCVLARRPDFNIRPLHVVDPGLADISIYFVLSWTDGNKGATAALNKGRVPHTIAVRIVSRLCTSKAEMQFRQGRQIAI